MRTIKPFGEYPMINKIVLEIASGRGDKTRELAMQMVGGGGRLIVTDISDEHFEAIRTNLSTLDLAVDFIRTSALKLAGIRPGSVDLVVCNHALSVINAIVGQGELALHKFYEVLKPGGKLYVEEELPHYMAASSAQLIWAEKWRLLKAAQLLSGSKPTNEYQPDILEALVSWVGFKEIEISDEINNLPVAEWWPPFELRLTEYLNALDDETLQAGLSTRNKTLKTKTEQTGSMEVPYFILTALKPWRIE
jgi:ubiquinone/menaquinone biosynthesis C-methylase UbiE